MHDTALIVLAGTGAGAFLAMGLARALDAMLYKESQGLTVPLNFNGDRRHGLFDRIEFMPPSLRSTLCD